MQHRKSIFGRKNVEEISFLSVQVIFLFDLHFSVKRRQNMLSNICMVFLKPAYPERFKSDIPQIKQTLNKYEPKVSISFKIINMVNIGYISNSERKGRKKLSSGCTRELLIREICYQQLWSGTSVFTENMKVFIPPQKAF